MKRIELFKKCSKKLPGIENFITKQSEITLSIIESNNINLSIFIGRGEGGIYGKVKPNSACVINLQEKGLNSHSIIFVKSEFLPNGWALFDPNGKRGFEFSIIYRNLDVTNNYLDVCINEGINLNVSDSINPGYCGTFGLLFLVFLYFNINNPNWITLWLHLLSKLKIKQDNSNKGIELAYNIQLILQNNSNYDIIIYKIYELIQLI